MTDRRRHTRPPGRPPHRRQPEPAAATRRPFLQEPAGWLLLAVVALYVGLAWVTCGRAEWWALGVVDGQQVFAIDDAWRYYLAKTAWTDPALYHWSYLLPGAAAADGLLATLTAGELWLMRALHAIAGGATLWLVYLTGLQLGATRRAMTVSVLLLGLMPLYAFVFLSFYGENWLTLALAAGIWCFVSGRERAAVVLFSLLPLLRPEGIFMLAPLALHLLLQRRFALLALLGAPGFLYALYLLATLERIGDYMLWRLELASVLQHAHTEGLRGPWRFFDTFNPLWTVPALCALALPPMRRWWPVFAGAALWLAIAIGFVATRSAFHEGRYYLSVLPALAIGWPLFFAWLGSLRPSPRFRRGVAVAFGVLSLCVLAEHFLQLDPVKAGFGDRRWPIAGVPAGRDYFGSLSAAANQRRANVAAAVAGIVRGNPDIERVLITNTELFYHLDPAIEERVPVVYLPTNEAIAGAWLGGAYFGMQPGDPPHAWYRLRMPAPGERKLVLFQGAPQMAGFSPVHADGLFALYLVAVDSAPQRAALPPAPAR
ncbi:MAG: hypothetical protein ACOY33_07995 [Pseudomonadota bacterium]